MASKVKVIRCAALQRHFQKGGCVPIATSLALTDGDWRDAEVIIHDVRNQMARTGQLRNGGWWGGIGSALDLLGIRFTKRVARVKYSDEYENGNAYQGFDVSVMRLRQTVAQCIKELPAGVSAIFRSSKSGRSGGHAIYFDGVRRILWNGHMRERIDVIFQLG